MRLINHFLLTGFFSAIFFSNCEVQAQAVDSTGLDRLVGESAKIKRDIASIMPPTPVEAVNWQITAINCRDAAVIGPPNTTFELISEFNGTGVTTYNNIIRHVTTNQYGIFIQSGAINAVIDGGLSYWIRKSGVTIAAFSTRYMSECQKELN